MLKAVHLSDLTLARGERVLVRGLSLTLQAGEAVALTGPNGSGKTTLLRAVAGLVRPSAGAITFDGVTGPFDPDIARADHLHWVGWQDGLKPNRTAWEELRFQALWTGGTEAAACAALADAGLAPLADLPCRQLSAGQRRRLTLARLAAASRALWLLDEPLAPLDADWRAAFGCGLQRHLDGGGLVLAAVHDPLPVPARTVRLVAETAAA